MAFQDIFAEARKKLTSTLGLGQPGLGTFGQQVKNTFKPVANLATRKLPSFNAFNTASNFARQQMPRFQGAVSNIARSQVQREIRPRINAVRNTINLASTAGRFANRNLNPMSEHNFVPRALNYVSKGMAPMPNEANTRDRFQRILGAGTDIVIATNPLLNVATTADKFLSSKTNKQRLGSLAEGTANALLGGKGQIAIDALGRGLGKNIVKSAGKTVIRNMPRNLATGALYGGGSALRQDKSAKEIAKDAVSGAIVAQGADMLLSPRVTYGLSRELLQKPVSNAANAMMQPVVSAMGAMPGKGKKTADALSNEARKGQEIVDLAKSKHTPYEKRTVDIFGAQPKTQEFTKKNLNIDVNGYNHQVDNYGLRHALKKHSTDEIPLSEADLRRIPDVLSNPDEIISEGKNKLGLETLKYKKRINGRTLYVEEIRTGQGTLSFKTMYNQKTPSGASLGRNPEAIRLSQNEMPTPSSVRESINPNTPNVNPQSTQGASSPIGRNSVQNPVVSAPARTTKPTQAQAAIERNLQNKVSVSSFDPTVPRNGQKLIGAGEQSIGLPEGRVPVTSKKQLLDLQRQGREGYIKLKDRTKPINLTDDSTILDTEKTRESVRAGLQQKIDDFERLNYGDATSDLTGGVRGANSYQNLTRSLQAKTSGLVERGMSSGNKTKVAIARGIRGLFGGSGDAAEVITRRGQFRGGVQDAENLSNNFMKMCDDLLPDKLSKEKVWAFLDPELSKVKVTEADLSPQELEAVSVLRQASDLINDTNFSMGKISHETWLKGKDGKYITRAYEDYDLPPELSEAFGGGKGKLDLGQYKTRGEVTDWKQENAIKDPGYLAAKRIQSTFQNKAINDYSSWIAKQGDMVSDVEKAGYTKLSESPMWGDLSGKYVRKDKLEGIKGFYFDNKYLQGAYDAITAYDRNPVRQFLKKTKTVYNPATRLGNQTSNRVFAAFNGINPISMEKNIQTFAKNELKQNGKYTRYLRQNGVLGNDMTKYELVKQLADDGADAGMLKRADDYFQNTYGAADDEAKVAAFKYWLDKGKTLDEALTKVRNGFQDYSKVGLFYDLAAKMPIVGKPFVRFQSELMRIIKNSAMENPLSLATVIGSITAIGYGSSKLSGESDEDRKTRENRFGTPVIPFTQIPLVFQTPWGEVNVARMFGMYETAGADTKNKNIVQRASKYLPFDVPTNKDDLIKSLGNDVMLGGVTNLITDTDFRGKSISDPDQTKYQPSTLTPTEKFVNRAGYVYHNYQIPFLNDIENVIRASVGAKNIYGKEQTTGQAAARLAGVKVEQFGPQQAEAQRTKDMEFEQYKRDDNQKLENSVIKKLMNGEIDQNTANKRIQNINKGGTQTLQSNGKAFKGSDGWKYINKDGQLKTADTEQEANAALAKDDFDKSGKKSATINGTYFYRKENGDIGSYTEAELNFKVRDQQMEKAKENNNYGAWTKLAQEKQKDLEQQWKDADGDPLAQLEIENKLIDHYQNMAKYASYGGLLTMSMTTYAKNGIRNQINLKLKLSSIQEHIKSLLLPFLPCQTQLQEQMNYLKFRNPSRNDNQSILYFRT